MRTMINLLLVLAAFGPTVNAYAQALGVVNQTTELARFAASGGSFETIDGRPIDPTEVDANDLKAFVVRPGGSTRRVLLERANGGLRVSVLDDQGRALTKHTLAGSPPPSVRLAALTEDDQRARANKEGAWFMVGLGGLFLGLTCVAGMGTCPWVAAVIISYMALEGFERHDQRHHPESAGSSRAPGAP